MKKLAWLLCIICIITILVIPVYGLTNDTYKQSTSIQSQPTLDPILPSMEPGPTNLPINPKPDYEFNGPDEDGFWHSGYISYNKLTPEEIKNLLNSAITTMPMPQYSEMPSAIDEPWILGQVMQNHIENALYYCNIIRRLAGIHELTLNDEANLYAQYAAWISCNNASLSHTPGCHINIPEEFCELGQYATARSNLYSGNKNIITQLDAYVNDYTSNNLAHVGHRQHLLNPKLVSTGFGQVGNYKSMYVGNRITEYNDNFDFISWPTSDYFPSDTDMFNYYTPWSITFPTGSIKTPTTSDNFKITITHNNDIVAELIYGITPDMPSSSSYISTDEYIRISANYIGSTYIIFRPCLENQDELDGEYIVHIENLYLKFSNEPIDVTYKVNFFKLSNINNYILGDIDNDGNISAVDALMVMRYSLDVINFTEDQILRGDINNDGSVTIVDAVVILRIALGLYST